MITREQIRAARVVRGWGIRELSAAAKAAGTPVSFTAISRFENGADSRGETIRRLQTTLEREGFEFVNSGRPGVRWDADAPTRWADNTTPDA